MKRRLCSLCQSLRTGSAAVVAASGEAFGWLLSKMYGILRRASSKDSRHLQLFAEPVTAQIAGHEGQALPDAANTKKLPFGKAAAFSSGTGLQLKVASKQGQGLLSSRMLQLMMQT